MSQFEVIMPKMGESIEEATITKWFVKPGDTIKEDDILLEIATDKVDSEIPSPVAGTVIKLLYRQDETVPVGSVIAIIDLGGEGITKEEFAADGTATIQVEASDDPSQRKAEEHPPVRKISNETSSRFYSPLVRKIAQEENVSREELDSIKGSGLNGRVQKNDILEYIRKRHSAPGKTTPPEHKETVMEAQPGSAPAGDDIPVQLKTEPGDAVIEMDRVRKIIAAHMVRSKDISAHVTNVIEVDVTNVVNWRNRVRDEFEKKEGVKLTYLPVFLEATVKALKDFPRVNSSVEGDRIIVKKRINLGIAVSLENYNLIVPVIKNADNLNIAGLTRELNRLASAARSNKLKPDEIQDGTFSITNFGTFKNIIGTPIINQPQVAILAIGAIEKKPAVLETEYGDVIAIRHKMFLSLSYDHRIIDGALGGAFLRKAGDYIESFDTTRLI